MKWARPAVQAVISVLLLYMLISCGLLPAKYLGIAVAAVVVLFLITFLFSRSESLAARSVGTIVAVSSAGRKDSRSDFDIQHGDQQYGRCGSTDQ